MCNTDLLRRSAGGGGLNYITCSSDLKCPNCKKKVSLTVFYRSIYTTHYIGQEDWKCKHCGEVFEIAINNGPFFYKWRKNQREVEN